MSPRQGVVLYGPPASGKDTVTQSLADLDSRYRLFARLKVGSGKTAGYRMGTAEQLRQLETAGDVVYANSRYSSTYVIDRPGWTARSRPGCPWCTSVRSTASVPWSTATRPTGLWCCCGARGR